MTLASGLHRSPGLLWSLPFASLALGGLLLLPGGRLAYLIGVTVAAVLFASWIGINDHRTSLLRNRWTGPFALAGLIQVIVSSVGLQSWLEIAAACLLGAVVTTSLYFALGLLGWVGFGDVKFAAGLGLFVAIPTGWAGLYLLPIALAISSLLHLFRWLRRMPERPRSRHGLALATALAVLMTAAFINHS